MSILNPDYRVSIHCPDKNIYVEAPIPETFMFDTNAVYEAPFSSGISGKIVNMGKFFGIRGINQAMTAQFWQGSSETELGLSLEFQAEFSAEGDVMTPIKQLSRLTAPNTEFGLMRAPGPQIGSTFANFIMDQVGTPSSDPQNIIGGGSSLVAKKSSMDPTNGVGNGNNAVGATDDGTPRFGTQEWIKQHITNNISIRIGRYAYFDSVVISNVQQTFTSQPDEITGMPMYARVDIRFKPLFMVVESDIEKIFARTTQANILGQSPTVQPSIFVGNTKVPGGNASNGDGLTLSNPGVIGASIGSIIGGLS